MPEKICPLIVGGLLASNAELSISQAGKVMRCRRHECELWMQTVWATDGFKDSTGRCALRFMGEKNAEGKLPV